MSKNVTISLIWLAARRAFVSAFRLWSDQWLQVRSSCWLKLSCAQKFSKPIGEPDGRIARKFRGPLPFKKSNSSCLTCSCRSGAGEPSGVQMLKKKTWLEREHSQFHVWMSNCQGFPEFPFDGMWFLFDIWISIGSWRGRTIQDNRSSWRIQEKRK